MPIVRSMIRNSSQNVLYTIILFFIACVAFLILYINQEIYTQVIDPEDITSIFLLGFGVLNVVILSCFFHLLLLFGFGKVTSDQNLNSLSQHLSGHVYLGFLVCLDIVGCFGLVWLYLNMGLKVNWGYFLVIIAASTLFSCVTLVIDYDDFELSSSQDMKLSIGASWAYGAVSAFYEIILSDMPRRMTAFEKEHDITLLIKKLVIICPLSCNANGSLDSRDGNIENVGNLKEIVIDEGANNNRTLKTNVYKVNGPREYYVAAEIPSPLATLYEKRDVMDNVILEYHRRCFIETLKSCLSSSPCIILEYDDLNSQEPLHSFILSRLGG